MYILGILIFLVLPYLTGTVFNIIFRQKETNQSETYLIGFFSLFLLQGVVFALSTYLGWDFTLVSDIYTYISYALIATGVIGVIFNIIKSGKNEKTAKQKMSKDDWILLGLMVLVTIGVIFRMVMLYGYIREDIMLETVRINVNTGTINKFNPFNGQPYELGLIKSKMIITLPAYYTYWCVRYGIDVRELLYIVLPLQTFFCVLFACYQNATMFVNTRKKYFTMMLFAGVLVLSGDYFEGAIGYRILWNGYSGETIISAIGALYLIYLGIRMYKFERGDLEDKAWNQRIGIFLKMMILFASSVFLASIAKGVVIYVICMIAIIVCCTIRGGKEAEE